MKEERRVEEEKEGKVRAGPPREIERQAISSAAGMERDVGVSVQRSENKLAPYSWQASIAIVYAPKL